MRQRGSPGVAAGVGGGHCSLVFFFFFIFAASRFGKYGEEKTVTDGLWGRKEKKTSRSPSPKNNTPRLLV
jgi:hypothetical protein